MRLYDVLWMFNFSCLRFVCGRTFNTLVAFDLNLNAAAFVDGYVLETIFESG